MSLYIQNEIITYAIRPDFVLGMYNVSDGNDMEDDLGESRS